MTTEAERRKNVEGAIASVRQSGFEFTQEELDNFERLIRGEVTSEQFIQEIKDRVERLRITNPEYFWQGDKP